MDKGIVKILKSHGCEYMADDYKEMIEEIETFVKERDKAIDVIQCCTQLKDKKIKDLLNWVKSDLAQETNNKIGKTETPYRTDKIKFLNKLLELENL